MIDQPCKDGEHKDCRGDTWCDCQHVEAPKGQVLSMEGKETQCLTVQGIPSAEEVGEIG